MFVLYLIDFSLCLVVFPPVPCLRMVYLLLLESVFTCMKSIVGVSRCLFSLSVLYNPEIGSSRKLANFSPQVLIIRAQARRLGFVCFLFVLCASLQHPLRRGLAGGFVGMYFVEIVSSSVSRRE